MNGVLLNLADNGTNSVIALSKQYVVIYITIDARSVLANIERIHGFDTAFRER